LIAPAEEDDMIAGTAVEWYRFTCPQCLAQWVAHYEVRRYTDDAGQSRPFYRCHGLPCEAPARAGTACPICHHAPVQAELLDLPATDIVPESPALSRPGQPAVRRSHGPVTGLRQLRFKAIVSLDSGGQQLPATQYPRETHSLMVHASPPDLPGSDRYFPAVIIRDDEEALRPGDSQVIVTISVPDDEASEFFSAGRPFELWKGTDVGHGTVSRQVFFS
jgi:hypothetical protein